MKTTRSLNLLSAALAAGLTLTSVRAADITPAEIKTIAEEGFIYGLPIVMNYGVMYEYAVDKNSGQYKAPFNQISNEARVFTYKDTSVITPNSDTPYSILWLDVRAEPIVLSFPAVAYRTQLFNPEDMPNVVKIQAGYKVQPLSQYLKQPAPPAAPTVNFPKINKEMVKTSFFDYLAFALQFAPAEPQEKEIREKLHRLGDLAALSQEQKAAVMAGVKEGEAKIKQYLESGQKNINGWKVGSLFGDSAFYNGDWLKRAAAAQ